jgi:hypothetical protein
MEKRAKGILKGLAATIIGAGLAFLGVCVWIDGNTGFGAGLIAVGAVIIIAWFSSVVDARKKARKA